jgi:hypothetical protein
MQRPQRSPVTRTMTTRLAATIALVAAAGAFAACNPGGSVTTSLALPSIEIPSSLPSIAIPSIGASLSVTGSGGVAACVDPATAAILSQLAAPGADVPTLLEQNKDALAQGLANFKPGDQATQIWKDNLEFALKAGDMTSAAQQIQSLTSGQVAISSC